VPLSLLVPAAEFSLATTRGASTRSSRIARVCSVSLILVLDGAHRRARHHWRGGPVPAGSPPRQSRACHLPDSTPGLSGRHTAVIFPWFKTSARRHLLVRGVFYASIYPGGVNRKPHRLLLAASIGTRPTSTVRRGRDHRRGCGCTLLLLAGPKTDCTLVEAGHSKRDRYIELVGACDDCVVRVHGSRCRVDLARILPSFRATVGTRSSADPPLRLPRGLATGTPSGAVTCPRDGVACAAPRSSFVSRPPVRGADRVAAYMNTEALPYWPRSTRRSRCRHGHTAARSRALFWVVLPGSVLWGDSFSIALAAVAGPSRFTPAWRRRLRRNTVARFSDRSCRRSLIPWIGSSPRRAGVMRWLRAFRAAELEPS